MIDTSYDRTTLDSTSPRARRSSQPGLVRPMSIAVSRVATALVLLAIGGVFVARCIPVARSYAITSDETTHLSRIFHLLRNGSDLGMWELGAPRLPHLLGGAASYWSLREVGIFAAPSDLAAINQVVLSGMPRVLLPARMVAVGWGIALIALVFWATARTRGAATGLVAAALVSLVPECLAHSAIAGSDMPFTTSAFLALIVLTRYLERPTAGRWIMVGLAVGLAWAMRHTALVLVMLAAAAHLWAALRKPRAAGLGPLAEVLAGSGIATLSMAVLAFAVLWVGDGLGTVRLSEVAGKSSGSLPRTLGPFALADLPVPTSAISVVKQIRHQNAGHEAYLCGEFRQTGWPSYFPIAFLLKTPTGLLALFVLCLARAKWARPTPWDAVVLAFLGILWLMLVRNKVNIGVRYVLLTYPIAISYVARMFEPRALRDRVWGPISLVALAWFAFASIGASGRYLSYFNEIGGGPRSGWMYLADSNLDWGQDFDALTAAVKRLDIREVTTDVSSERRLVLPGVFAYYNPSKVLQVQAATAPNRRLRDEEGGYIPVYTRYVAVSTSRLLGLYSQNDMSYLRTRRLVERIGDTIFLFDMDRPATEPF